jgi:hypothetical protein
MSIVWTGPRDDKTAIWEGFMLRAERVGRGAWWWNVYDNEGKLGCREVVDDDVKGETVRTGKLAREAAEAAARRYVEGQDD